MSRWFAALLILICASSIAIADDLGVIGPTYPIREPHLLQWIEQSLQEKVRSGELQRLQEQARARAVEEVRNPQPLPGISSATSARTYYYDPGFTLSEPVRDDKGRVLFPAGTRKNPLEIVSLSKHLLFFDARDARQVDGARKLIDHYRGKVKPILVGGSYLQLMKNWRIPVYFDQQGRLVSKLGIAQVPALVSQEGMRLRIDVLVM